MSFFFPVAINLTAISRGAESRKWLFFSQQIDLVRMHLLAVNLFCVVVVDADVVVGIAS